MNISSEGLTDLERDRLEKEFEINIVEYGFILALGSQSIFNLLPCTYASTHLPVSYTSARLTIITNIIICCVINSFTAKFKTVVWDYFHIQYYISF